MNAPLLPPALDAIRAHEAEMVAIRQQIHAQPELAYEPTIALDGGEDGLAAYRSLAPQSVEALRPGGRLLVEVGAGQSEAVRDLLTEAGLSIAGTRRDLLGTERVVVAGRPR